MGHTFVVAVGGNSLIKDANHQSVPDQWLAVYETCSHIADMCELDDRLVIVHGNGPQVGFILLRSEKCRSFLHRVPLDTCDADTQGAIGYQIQQALGNEFHKRKITKPITSIVTQVLVDKNDPNFESPSKPIGIFYTKEEADMYGQYEGWIIKQDSDRGYRRVVPSPRPIEIIEKEAVLRLLDNGFAVIAGGGGGIPVIRDDSGLLQGVEGVIDKDYTASLLAKDIGADVLIISTTVEKVALNWGTPEQVELDYVTLAEAKRYVEEGHFAKGSMLPKMDAAIQFIEGGGKMVIITKPSTLKQAVKGTTGTHIVP